MLSSIRKIPSICLVPYILLWTCYFRQESSWRHHSKAVALRTQRNGSISNKIFDDKFKNLLEPLLDLKLVAQTIEEWSRPLPARYMMKPLVFVGPSGVGKGRLIGALLKDYSRFFKKVVTHTTRKPRPDEVERQVYHFTNNQTFHEMVTNNSFIEWARVHNNYYGTTIESLKRVQQEGKIPIMEIDVQGAKSIKNCSTQYDLYPKYLFIKPSNISLLRERLLVRGTETAEEIQLRLSNAVLELAEAERRDQPLFDSVIVNDDIEEATRAFFRLVRDWYPAIPSAARMRMLQRRLRNIKQLAASAQSLRRDATAPGIVENQSSSVASSDVDAILRLDQIRFCKNNSDAAS